MDNLINYLPEPLQVIREFKAMATAEQPELADYWALIEASFADQFIDESVISGVERRESMYKLTPKATDSLDERKFRIKTKENERVPYTERALAKQLAALCGADGYKLSVDVANYKVTVKVELKSKSNFGEVNELVDRVVPLDMVLDISLLYNQHLTLAKFAHERLQHYTHDQLRNEVLV